jgi:hypothetical protein
MPVSHVQLAMPALPQMILLSRAMLASSAQKAAPFVSNAQLGTYVIDLLLSSSWCSTQILVLADDKHPVFGRPLQSSRPANLHFVSRGVCLYSVARVSL